MATTAAARARLAALGLTPQRCPATRVLAPNMTRSFGAFHISYARRIPEYGSDTTALVLRGRVFLVLSGDHAADMVAAAEARGVDGCIDLFVERLEQASLLSEHHMAVGVGADPFELEPTTREVLGQAGFDRLAAAVRGGSVAA